MKGVFEVSGASRYNDKIAVRYHFPLKYLSQAQKCVGDWIVYRETRAEYGRMAYIAVAHFDRIDPDPETPGMFYARMSQFLELDQAVSYRDETGRFAERFLRDMPDAAAAGRSLRGRSIRTLEGSDFAAIVNAGLAATFDPANARRLELDEAHADPATRALLAGPLSERRIEQVLMNRKIRDAAFRGLVLTAYDNTCAVTGLRIINGGGKAEAQAAHIWSVADGGPDEVQNGIALSATVHWLFDRHLIALNDNLELLVSHNRVPEAFRQLFPHAGQSIRLPANKALRPKPEYVARHRARFAGFADG
jgi:Predicted restriction endonuclease